MSQINSKLQLGGKEYWRSLDQLADSPEFHNFLKGEFPHNAPEINDPMSRRSFISIMGASLALMGLAGCRKPLEKIVPYVDAPETALLGKPELYATTMPMGTSAYGLVVTSNDGRPTKIDGNKLHPSSLGKANSLIQASILNLYDPDRSKEVLHNGSVSSWDDFVNSWTELKSGFDENGGAGLAVLSEQFSSLTLSRLKKAFLTQFPNATWTTHESVSDENIFAGVRLATGSDLRPVYHVDKAKVIVSLDSDLLMMDSENVTSALGFAEGRRMETVNDEMNRLYVVESGYSITGAMADHRLKLKSSLIGAFTAALALELVARGMEVKGSHSLSRYSNHSFDKKWLTALADDLIKHHGKSLLIAGRRQGKDVHALILAINEALGNIGETVSLHPLTDVEVSDRSALAELIGRMNNGSVNNLYMFGGNPANTTPADLNFADALKKVNNSIHLGHYLDSTAKQCNWHINRTHFLESWGDARSADGTKSVIQPLIEPLFFGKSDVEFLNLLITGEFRSGHNIVRESWEGLDWRFVLHDGLLKDSVLPEVAVELSDSLKYKFQTSIRGFEVVFAADHSVYDGRFANNGWMQELPDPITKLVWDNVAMMSPTSAEKIGIKNGDVVKINLYGRTIEIPTWIQPGHADDSVTLPLGYGENYGRVMKDVGVNVQAIRASNAMNFADGATIEPTGRKVTLASTQNHGSMEGRPLIREATHEEYQHDPKFVQHDVHVPDLKSLWDEHKYEEGYQWGMTIDLNSCIGCGTCTVACQSENNIPIVGKKNADYGREMHWIRVDRYFNGDQNDPEIVFQPMACGHCEMAPCEQVCPVAATTHNKEGLNVMTYNRCIGTRYCSNNCPYKVRRFNFFNYTNQLPEIVQLAMNPDVTVRARGVMEKCNYCMHRINRVKRDVKLEDREMRDGEMTTACQQACPTNAIQFGNLLDKSSEVVKAKQSDRNYEVLAEINLRPRTSYHAKLRNPNPDLKS